MVVARVSYEPPIIIGFAKSAIDSINETRKALPKPGKIRGSVTLVNTFQRLAPISRAASSRDGSMFFKQALKHHVAHREERHSLDNKDAPEAIDVVIKNS